MNTKIFNLLICLMDCVDDSADNEAYKIYDRVRKAFDDLDDNDKTILGEAYLEYTGDTDSFDILSGHLGKVLDSNYGYYY